MKTTKLLMILVLSVFAVGAMAQGGEQPKADKPNTKWPSGKNTYKAAKDSGQHAVTSYYVDRRAKKWTLGLGGGLTFFYGDADKIQPSWHIRPFVKYSISQSFGLRGEYNIGKLRGARDFQNPTNFKDNFKFTSKIQDWSVQGIFTLGNISFLRPLRKTQMYLFVGLGQLSYRSTSTFIDQRQFVGGDYYLDHYFGKGTPNPNLGKEAKEFKDERKAIVPFGFGFKHNFGRLIDLGLEYRQTWLRSDNIDVYNTPVFQNRWLDQYGMLNVNIGFKLGSKGESQHYDWLNPVESIYDKIAKVEEKLDTLMGDKDKDGVSDFFDEEPNTPDSANVYGDGRAVDSDNDGVPDYKDKEPFSEKGTAVDEDGKMVDNDGDGVPDHRDQELNTPGGALVDVGGRAIKNNCCNCDDPYFPSVFFGKGKCVITPEMNIVLYEIANRMKQCPDKKLIVCGSNDAGKKYAGKKGGAESYCRANSIIDILVNTYGISRDRFIIDSNCPTTNPNQVDVRFGRAGEAAGNNSPSTPRSSR